MPGYSDNVFVNCPFDTEYLPIFRALVFTIFDCGFVARCAKEYSDATEPRIDKIGRLIGDCKYGVHDLSRTEFDKKSGLPRFNMPFELGLFLGAKKYGEGHHDQKMCCVLDVEKYRYQKFLSDISGQDVDAHGNDATKIIGLVRNWLVGASKRKTIPSEIQIKRRYESFSKELPRICDDLDYDSKEITFNDYTHIVSIWLQEHE